MATFFASNKDVTGYLSKQDIVRMEPTEPNSTFLRIRVEAKDEQVLVRRADMITGKPVLTWVSPYSTTPDDAVVLRIETIAYTRNDKMGASALDGVARWFETVDTAYIAVRRVFRADDGAAPREVKIDTFMRWDRVNKGFITDSIVPLKYAESNEDLVCWAQDFMHRLDRNDNAADQRKADWTVVSKNAEGIMEKNTLSTAFGRFVAQRKRDAATRKFAKE